jgi:hypothetical protein
MQTFGLVKKTESRGREGRIIGNDEDSLVSLSQQEAGEG